MCRQPRSSSMAQLSLLYEHPVSCIPSKPCLSHLTHDWYLITGHCLLSDPRSLPRDQLPSDLQLGTRWLTQVPSDAFQMTRSLMVSLFESEMFMLFSCECSHIPFIAFEIYVTHSGTLWLALSCLFTVTRNSQILWSDPHSWSPCLELPLLAYFQPRVIEYQNFIYVFVVHNSLWCFGLDAD